MHIASQNMYFYAFYRAYMHEFYFYKFLLA